MDKNNQTTWKLLHELGAFYLYVGSLVSADSEEDPAVRLEKLEALLPTIPESAERDAKSVRSGIEILKRELESNTQ